MAYINKNIRSKLLFFSLVIILLPIITLGILPNKIYNNSMQKSTNRYTMQIINQIKNNIESYIDNIDNIMLYISKSPEVIEYMQVGTEKDLDLEISNNISQLIQIYIEANPYISGIMIVNEHDKCISKGLERASRETLIEEEWYVKAIINPEERIILNKPLKRNVIPIGANSSNEIISISKSILHPITKQVLGVVLIDMNLAKLQEIINDTIISENFFFFLMDDIGEIIYAPVNKVAYRIDSKWLVEEEGQLNKKINNQKCSISYQTSKVNNWKIVGVFSVADILVDVKNISFYALIIGGLTMVVGGMLAVVFTKSITVPISELRNKMNEVEKGNFEVNFEYKKYTDEFRELGSGFNHMVKQIKNLLEAVYKEQKSKRKAELAILHSQIKPHFLYNTLGTIEYMADEHGAEDIVEIVQALNKLFRISLSKGKEIIKIKNEVEYVENYLKIQKVRYEDKLNYKIECDENIYEYGILKLVIQPIVENAIYHGIKEKRGPGFITIKIEKQEEKIQIKVIDNGKGIDAKRMEAINKMLGSSRLENTIESESGSGYGIYNVNSRIQLTYGMEYGICFEPNLDGGTVVKICIPANEY